jgi:hypothetical protein
MRRHRRCHGNVAQQSQPKVRPRPQFRRLHFHAQCGRLIESRLNIDILKTSR